MAPGANFEWIGFYGRYLIYAQEPIGFPLGVIKGLSFPFDDVANIMRGPIPLFAIPLKILSKIYPPLVEFYYFGLVEIISVFFSAFFAWGIAREFNARSFWTKLLAATLCGLSVSMLHKSSLYFGYTFLVMHTPLYLGCAYFYVRLYKYPYRKWKEGFLLVCMFISASLTGYYIFTGMVMGVACCLAVHLLEMLLRRRERKRIFRRTLPVIVAFMVGVLVSILIQNSLGNTGNFVKADIARILDTRYESSWGYGGGFGGGFHVADVLSVIIPPKDDENLPEFKRLGPTAYLAHLGFPVTTGDLQDGEHSGFAYAGTIPIGLWMLVIIVGMVAFLKQRRMIFTRLGLQMKARFRSTRNNDLLIRALGTSCVALYLISWGYIIHIAGHRIYNILTPSFIMTSLVPEFIYSRSIGRYALPFSLFVILTAITLFERYVGVHLFVSGRRGRTAFAILAITLVVAHVYEVSGYLRQGEITKGNEIVNTFSGADVTTIKKTVKNKVAIMIVPGFVRNMEWAKISYSLAFHGNIPISGSTIGGGPGESLKDRRQFARDVDDILAGRLQDIVKRYGNICVASPYDTAKKILAHSDLPLKATRLLSRDCVILTLR